MASMKCPCCKRTLNTAQQISMAVNHEEEDHRLNVAIGAATDLLAREKMRLYPKGAEKELAPHWQRLHDALTAFYNVDTELAERNYVISQLMTLEKELGT